jgi:hypothetical protein
MKVFDMCLRFVQIIVFLQLVSIATGQDDEEGGGDEGGGDGGGGGGGAGGGKGAGAAKAPNGDGKTLHFGTPLPVAHPDINLSSNDFTEPPNFMMKKQCNIS